MGRCSFNWSVILIPLMYTQLCTGVSLSGSSAYAVLGQMFQFKCDELESEEQLLAFRRNYRQVCTIAYPLNSTQCQQFTASLGYSCSCGQGGVYYMNISSVSLEDEATWNCRHYPKSSKNITLPVYYGPFTNMTISRSSPVTVTEGVTTGSVSCSAHCKPGCTYTWTRRNKEVSDNSVLLLRGLTRHEAGDYICTARNTATSAAVNSSTLKMIVYYSPRVQTTPSSSVTKIEGDALTVECTAVSNPPTTGYQWSYGSEVKSSGPQLSFPLLDRTDHGEYRCSATTQAGSDGILTGTATLQVTVNYPPKLTVRNVTETESQEATITCLADGRPDNFYFFPFVHTWKGHVIRHVTGQRVGREHMHVFVTSSYQDSGVYGCAVENGVSDGHGEKQQKGNIFVKINGSPKLTVGIRKEDIVEAKTGEMVTLLRTFYSSTSITSYTWRKDTKTLNSTRMFDTTVQLDIHGVVVEDKGYNFTLDIGQFDQDEHSGQYSLRVCNSIGCETSTITLKLQDMTHRDTGSVAGIVGGCVAGVVTVCLLIAGVVLLYRKGYRCNCGISKADDDNQKESETRGVDISTTYSTIDVPDQSERRTEYCSLESTQLQQYTGLKLYENTGVDKEAVDDVDTYEQGSQHAYENTGTALQNEPT